MFTFKCVSCQREQVFEQINVPPTSCDVCGSAVSMIRDTEPPPPVAREPDASFNTTRLAIMRGDQVGAGGRVFVSTMVYALGRELGHEDAIAEVARQLEAASKGELDADPLPVVRTITRLRSMFDVQLHLDVGATYISRGRSRAFHEFLASDCDVWVSCDDDVEADRGTLASLVEAVEGSTAICVAPCLLRQQTRVNVMLDPNPDERRLADGARVVSALGGGFGLVAISKAAAVRFKERYQKSLRFVDNDGRDKLAVFHELLHQGKWYGDDLSFFLRTPPGVRVEALATGKTIHAGLELDLEGFELRPNLLKIGEATGEPVPPPLVQGAPQEAAGEAEGETTVVDGQIDDSALTGDQKALLAQFMAGQQRTPDDAGASHAAPELPPTAFAGGEQEASEQQDAGQASVSGEKVSEPAPAGTTP